MTTPEDRGPVYAALIAQIDHLLDNLLPLASDDGALQILTAGRATVRTLRDLDLITPAEHESLLDVVHHAYRSHKSDTPT